MTYAGELYFEDNAVIKVDSFIIRPNVEVAFSVVAIWNGGHWNKSGIASFDGRNYVSDGPSTHVENGKKGPNCKVTFSKVDCDAEFLYIVGSWSEQGESYYFEGHLEQQS
jgi:hypothetical protein